MRLAAELGELDVVVILAEYFGVDVSDIVGDDDKLKVYISTPEAFDKYSKANAVAKILAERKMNSNTENKTTSWVEKYRQITADDKAVKAEQSSNKQPMSGREYYSKVESYASSFENDKQNKGVDNTDVKVVTGVNEDGSVNVETVKKEEILKANEVESKESKKKDPFHRKVGTAAIEKRRKEYFEKRKEKQKKLEEERLKRIAEMEAEGKIIEGEENRYKLITDDVLKDRMNAGKTVVSLLEEFSLPDRFKFRIYDRVWTFEKEGATFPKRRGRNKR